MLEIEKPATGEIKLHVKEKSAFMTTRLRQAFTYSLFVHVLVFAVFRVKFMIPQEDVLISKPIDVGIEAEIQESVHTDGTENKESLDSFPAMYPFTSMPSSFLDHHTSLQESKREALFFSQNTLPDPFSADLQKKQSANDLFSEHFYPLKIELSRELEPLKIIEDGSLFFKKKPPKSSYAHLQLTTSPFKIRYFVEVLGSTGKISGWSRKHELLDKKLQQYADFLIEKISFAPGDEKSYIGKVDLIFYCTGEEIKGMLR